MGNICFITYCNYLHISVTFALIRAALQEYWEYSGKATLMIAQVTQTFFHSFIHSFIRSISMCRIQWFLAVLKIFFDSCLLYTLSFHPFPPSSLPSSLSSSCHLFLGLPLSLVVSKFIYNTFWGILLSFILSTCPNQRNLFNFIVSVTVGFLTLD